MWPMFLSLVRPDRISSPITSSAAVTMPPPACARLAHGSAPARAHPAASLGDDLPVEVRSCARVTASRVKPVRSPPAPLDQARLSAPDRRSGGGTAAASAVASSTGTSRPLSPSSISAEGPGWRPPPAACRPPRPPASPCRTAPSARAARRCRRPAAARRGRAPAEEAATRSATPSQRGQRLQHRATGASRRPSRCHACDPGSCARRSSAIGPFFSCSRDRVRQHAGTRLAPRSARRRRRWQPISKSDVVRGRARLLDSIDNAGRDRRNA